MLVYGFLNLILTIVIMVPPASKLNTILLFVLTAVCYFLNLAVFWVFAFKYWITALATKLLIQQRLHDIQHLHKYKKV